MERRKILLTSVKIMINPLRIISFWQTYNMEITPIRLKDRWNHPHELCKIVACSDTISRIFQLQTTFDLICSSYRARKNFANMPVKDQSSLKACSFYRLPAFQRLYFYTAHEHNRHDPLWIYSCVLLLLQDKAGIIKIWLIACPLTSCTCDVMLKSGPASRVPEMFYSNTRRRLGPQPVYYSLFLRTT